MTYKCYKIAWACSSQYTFPETTGGCCKHGMITGIRDHQANYNQENPSERIHDESLGQNGDVGKEN